MLSFVVIANRNQLNANELTFIRLQPSMDGL
nr:MAG TPA: hypothetical protein [Caudoviricetes sp.]